jgi:predicted RNA binding protein YcfA (HicA-like mRNA interferase family)
MPPFGPISRRDLIDCLRQLGFDGPHRGKKHQIMVRGSHTLRIPNPHRGDIGRDLLSRVLKDAEISRDEWEKL